MDDAFFDGILIVGAAMFFVFVIVIILFIISNKRWKGVTKYEGFGESFRESSGGS